MSGPRITLIIPTRNRGPLLRATLASASAHAPEDVELLVADNDDQGAPAIAPPDRRTHVLPRPPAPLPMADNWERALDRARGAWVMLLSDKYHLVPGALRGLAAQLDGPAQVVQYDVGGFAQDLDAPRWHDLAALRSAAGAMLPVRALPASLRPTAPFLAHYRSTPMYHGSAPMLYNALVRRGLIERARARAGRFFLGCAPDVSSAIQLAAGVEHFLHVPRPAVLAHYPSRDESLWSAGAAVSRSAVRARQFVAENAPRSRLLATLPALAASIVHESVVETLAGCGLLDGATERRLWRSFAGIALEELAARRDLQAAADLVQLTRASRPVLGVRGALLAAARFGGGQVGGRLRHAIVRRLRGAPPGNRLEPVESLEAALRRASDAWGRRAIA